MARLFDLNNLQVAGDYGGPFALAFKNAAVTAGWTVRGSGDGDTRYAYDGVTAALPGGQQGSGGSFDCWQSATTRNNASTLIAGDAGNTSAWIVLEDGDRQLLLQQTDNATGWSCYGRLAYNPGTGGTPAFVGTSVDAVTIPTAATNEAWIFGSRAGGPSSGTIIPYNMDGYYHIWGDDAGGAGGAFTIGYVFVRTSDATVQQYCCVAAVESGSEVTGDQDPVVVYYGSTLSSSTAAQSMMWNSVASTMQTAVQEDGLGAPWKGQGVSITTYHQLTQLHAVTGATSRHTKGLVTTSGLAGTSAARGWGDRGVDQNGLGWVHLGANSGLLMPWPDAATIPSP